MELVKSVSSRVGIGRCLERIDHLIPWITLTYMHFDSEQLVNRVAEAFMAKYPNIKVEAQAFSTDGYNDTLLNLAIPAKLADQVVAV